MRRLAASLLLTAACTVSPPVAADQPRFRFASVEEGSEILVTPDEFIHALTAIDLRLRTKRSATPTQAEFLEFLALQARSWPSDEVSLLTPLLREVEARLSEVSVPVPARIQLVRTSDLVEAGAPHTRGTAIVLPGSSLSTEPQVIRRMLFHEVFHVLSKSNPDLRDKLYRLLGYSPCSTVELPSEVARRLVTNPDAPHSVHFIRVSAAGAKTAVLPLLFARVDTDTERPFFEAFDLRFLPVDTTPNRCTASGQRPLEQLLSLDEIADYFEQVGRNTKYVIHPEEILAENFALLVIGSSSLPDPEIPAALKRLLFR